jgi:hypothetical protein
LDRRVGNTSVPEEWISALVRGGPDAIGGGDQVNGQVMRTSEKGTRLAEQEDDSRCCRGAAVVTVKPPGGTCRDGAPCKATG